MEQGGVLVPLAAGQVFPPLFQLSPSALGALSPVVIGLPEPGRAGSPMLEAGRNGEPCSCSCQGWIPARAGVSPAKLNSAQEAPGGETYI